MATLNLIKFCSNYFLLKVDFKKMAKDLPENTVVFCLSEKHTSNIGECVRGSGLNDNCYGCQPLLASSLAVKNKPLLDKAQIENLLKTLKKPEKITEEITSWSVDVEMEQVSKICDECGNGVDGVSRLCNFKDCDNKVIKITDNYINITDIRFGDDVILKNKILDLLKAAESEYCTCGGFPECICIHSKHGYSKHISPFDYGTLQIMLYRLMLEYKNAD